MQNPYIAMSSMNQMIDDMYAVASMDNKVLTKLSSQLQQQAGFLTSAALADIVTQHITDDRQGQAAFNALQNLEPDSIPKVVTAIEQWRRSSNNNRERFSDELFAVLEPNLLTLIRQYTALNRAKKAEQLRNILGNELQGLAFVCDARPVFNRDRDEIEGMIPVTTLKLVYERQNMETEEIELVLNADQLRSLREGAERAEKKLVTLKATLASWLPEGYVEEEVES